VELERSTEIHSEHRVAVEDSDPSTPESQK
jgi:hypothetical protein